MRRLMWLSFILIVCASMASAGTVLTFTNTFSGTPAAGYITAEFSAVAGGVNLTITSFLGTGENVDPGNALYLNIDPSKDALLGSLNFSLVGNTGFSEAATVTAQADNYPSKPPTGYKADGVGGYYDILFTYDPATKAFTNGESQTYLITGAGITPDDFTNFFSLGSDPPDTYVAATHIQNTPNGGGGSAWMSPGGPPPPPIPEPGTLFLLGSGLIGLAHVARRKFRA